MTAFDRAGGAAVAQGSLATIDNVIDTTTGTVKGKARFANPGAALFPNQFVNVTVLVDTLKSQVIVPSTAIRHGPQGDFVCVLQPDSTVKVRQVKSRPEHRREHLDRLGPDRRRDGDHRGRRSPARRRAGDAAQQPHAAGATNGGRRCGAAAGVVGGDVRVSLRRPQYELRRTAGSA